MMSVPSNPYDAQLAKWLKLLGAPSSEGRGPRERAIDEMRAVGAATLFPLLAAKLHDPDVDTRCQASRAILWIDAPLGLELVLPQLNDPDTTIRWDTCGLMHEFGDEHAVDLLLERLRKDPDPQIRGTAAYALGGIGSARALPALIEAMNKDFELDGLGHTPSSAAEVAIDEINRKNNTVQ